MTTKRKTFTKAFKQEAVRLLEQGHQSAADIARELGIKRNQLYKWLDRRRLVSHWVHPCRVSITQWTRRYRRSAKPRLPCVRDDTYHHSHNGSTPFHGYRGLSALVSTLPGR
jgi:AraC-like DNA-binding protein